MVTCETCKYWSEMIARKPPGSMEVESLCLCTPSPKTQQFTKATDKCDKHEPGDPVDSPW